MPTSIYNTASLGLLRTQNDFSRAATSFIRSFTPALGAAVGEVNALDQIAPNPLQNQGVNPFAGNLISPEAFIASSLSGLFNANSTDPVSTFVSLIQADQAFSANISAFKTIDDTQSQLLNIIA